MALSYSELRGGVTRTTQFGEVRVDLSASDFALAPDGSRFYLAAARKLMTYDTRTLSVIREFVQDNRGAGLGNVEVGPTGKVYFAAFPSGVSPDTWVQDANGAELGSVDIGDLADRSIRISGDGLRILSLPFRLGLKVVTSP